MRNPERVLNTLKENSMKKDYKIQRIYRNLYNQEILLLAYNKVCKNSGSMTPGSDGQTMDGMGVKRINLIIEKLKDESYQPSPSRRVYIKKKGNTNKLRPLGVANADDKIVQEAMRMMLEVIYEPTFETTSHGFRNDKSCHTALDAVQKAFTGTKWFIEGDIKGFFDNIEHEILINILKEKIDDEKFICLVRKFLNAGYLENWTFHKTYTGTPQGGILSPILSNIYLDKLDKYMNEYITAFEKGKERKRNSEYRSLEKHFKRVHEKLKQELSKEDRLEAVKELKELQKLRNSLPYGQAMDQDYRRMKYVRYADDFLIGVIGSKEDCVKIKADIKEFLESKLKLELSDEKTLITNATKPAKFLGYDIYLRKSNLAKRDKAGRLKRDYTERVVLSVNMDTIKSKLLEYGALVITNNNVVEVWQSKSRYYMKDNDDLEILDQYNAEIRGFRNYYKIANNSSVLHKFKYIMEYSMYKTYATKYRTQKSDIIKKYKRDGVFGVNYHDAKGEKHRRTFYNEGFAREKVEKNKKVDEIPDTVKYRSGTSLIDRLKANICEHCGCTEGEMEIHHVKRLKDLQGKDYWTQFVISRRRKTVVLCEVCHKKLHAGKL